MVEDKLYCPYCQNDSIEIEKTVFNGIEGFYQAYCDYCYARPPIQPTPGEAVKWWRKK